jgi:PAS domain S-box-containing protein
MDDEILILSADLAQQRRLQRLAFDLGAKPCLAKDGDEALRQLRERGAPLALVVDPGAQPAEALRLLQALRDQASAERSALLVLAANPQVEAAVSARSAALGLVGLLASHASALAMSQQWSALLKDQRAHRAQWLRRALRPPKLPKTAQAASKPASATGGAMGGREAGALARIAGLGLARGLDLDAALQRLTQEAAQAFNVQGAVLLLALEDGPRFAAWLGALPGANPPAPAEWAQCLEALAGDLPAAVRVPDATTHPALRGSVMVARGALGACLAAPVVTAEGRALGTLCLAQAHPRDWGLDQMAQLSAVARRLADEIGLAQQMGRLHEDLDKQWDEAAAHGERVDALRAVLENLETGVLLHDGDGRILVANRRLAHMTGLMALQIEGGSFKDFSLELAGLFDDPEGLPPSLRNLPEGPYSLREVLATQRPRRQVLRWTARPIPWGPAWYELATVEDVTAEADLEARSLEPAVMDAVTGLPLARVARALGGRMAEQARHRGRPLSLLLLELDGLPSRGDERRLLELGGLLRSVPRPTDRAAHWGQASFLVIFPDTDETPSRRVAERLRRQVAALPHGLTLSGGLAWGPGGTSFEALLDAAERKLALAASSGGDAIL